VSDYRSLQALEHFVLEESWVVGIEVRPDLVELDVDLCYARDHPELLPPRKGEYAYFRRGMIRFVSVSSASWEKSGLLPATDASGEEDWGHFDAVEWEGTAFKLTGDFGLIELEATAVEVELTGPA
jgi:hypothetical protein